MKRNAVFLTMQRISISKIAGTLDSDIADHIFLTQDHLVVIPIISEIYEGIFEEFGLNGDEQEVVIVKSATPEIYVNEIFNKLDASKLASLLLTALRTDNHSEISMMNMEGDIVDISLFLKEG